MDVAFIFLIPPQISITTFFFFPYFGNVIATIGFFFLGTSHFKHTAHTLEQADQAAGISVITLPKFMHSLSPTFSLSLSYFC